MTKRGLEDFFGHPTGIEGFPTLALDDNLLGSPSLGSSYLLVNTPHRVKTSVTERGSVAQKVTVTRPNPSGEVTVTRMSIHEYVAPSNAACWMRSSP